MSASEARTWATLAVFATAALASMWAMVFASRGGAALAVVAAYGLGSVACAGIAARIAVKFSRS